VRLRAALVACTVTVLTGTGAAPSFAQDAPRNFWDLREPAHTEEHAQRLERPAAPAPESPQPPAQSPARPGDGAPTAPAAESAAAAAPSTGTGSGESGAPGSAAPAAAQPQPGDTAIPAASSSAVLPAEEGEPAQPEPRSIEGLYRLGDRAQRRGDVQEAERIYREVLQRAPYHFLTHLALGRLYLPSSPSRAREQLETAQRIHPSSEDAHYLLGQVYEALGRDLDAAEAYRRTIYLNPRHYNANARLRSVLRRMRAGRSVVQRAAESFYEHPSLASLTLFGRIVMEQTEPRQAVLEFEEIKRRQPELAEVQLWLARAYRAAGDAPEEIDAYRSYLVQRPDAIGVRLLLVERLVERGWYQDGVALLKPLEAASGDNAQGLPPATKARVTFVRSRLLSAQQQPGQAGEMLLQARAQGYADEEIEHAFAEDLALFPEEASLWIAYSDWLRAASQPAEAADALARAGRLDASQRGNARTRLLEMRKAGAAPVAVALALGELAWAEGDGADALAQLDAVPPGDPLDHRAALLRGLIHRSRGETDAALDAFTRYVFSFQDPRDMLYARGNLFWTIDRKAEALAVWRDNPNVLLRHPDVLLHVAEYHGAAGDVPAEIATRERLAQALPGNQSNLVRLADLYEQQGRQLEAVLLRERVLAVRPRDARLLQQAGKGWMALGNVDRASPLLQRASQLQALDPESSATLASQLYRSHQLEDALRVYWSLYMLQPEHPDLPRVLPELVLSLPATLEQRAAAAQVAERAGRLQQAAEVYEAILADTPGDADARLALAALYLRQDKSKQAEAVLSSPDGAKISSERALQLMATVHQRMGRKPALVATLERLQQLRPDDAQLTQQRGLLLAELRRPAEARPLLEHSLDASPRDITLRIALADVTLALGDAATAEQHLKAALSADPQRTDAQRRLIELLLREERWDDAAQRLEVWVSKNPRDAVARYNLVTAYLKLFRTDAATPHYEALRAMNPVRARPLEPYFP
jgi:tetratricopeptide (TPR) repeat protein